MTGSTAGPDPHTLEATLTLLGEEGLLRRAERRQVAHLLHPTHPFAAAVAAACSIHLHIKVPTTTTLPHERLTAAGQATGSCCDGYVKYAMPGGINVIASSIPIRQEDLFPDAAPLTGPVLDHLGVDLREPGTRTVFDAVPARATETGWRHVAQGGDGRGVFCCHTEVEAKHWVYAPDPRVHPPIEFALGELVLHEAAAGCDLRPIDPAHPRAAELLQACCATQPGAPTSRR